ncbi:MAG: hypothetical protein ACTH8F_07540 [Microbacterium sp.]|uniref:hypothetical protein n=1 Tax=Microbacterium sp. TaxID=51671 RepID=UPI003F9678F9
MATNFETWLNTNSWVLIVIIAVLLVAIIAVHVGFTRHMRNLEQEYAERKRKTQEAHEKRMQELDDAHQVRMQEIRDEHTLYQENLDRLEQELLNGQENK